MKLSVILLIISTVTQNECVVPSCTVNIDDIPKKNDPIYVKNRKLHIPESTIIGKNKIVELKWSLHEIGRIMCTGNGNNIEGQTPSEIKFKCTAGNQLIDIETTATIDLKKIKCKNEIIVDVDVNENTKCGRTGTGTMLKVGFKYDELYPAYDICYNYKSGSVIYSKHIIPGQARKKNPATKFERSTDYLKRGLPFYTMKGAPYLTINQQTRFLNTFTDPSEQENIIMPSGKPSNFLARGHLTPVADGIFNTWKASTMLYVNVAPEWQVINGCNWKRVENIARNMAYFLNDNLQVYTGTTGTLEMYNKNTKKLEALYLTTKSIQNDNTVPNSEPIETQESLIAVPKYYWKVLSYKTESIAFITLNNPYAVNEPDICTDICKLHNYPTKSTRNEVKGFHNYNYGRTYCCAVQDFYNKLELDLPFELSMIGGNVLSYIINEEAPKDEEPPTCDAA